jgi:hypothetical protein
MSRQELERFKKGLPLTRKQAIGAQCYECNGYSTQKADDCVAKHCPLYEWSPWGKSRVLRASTTAKVDFVEKMKRVRDAKKGVL